MTSDQITQLRQLLKKAKKGVRNLTPAGICYPLYHEVLIEKDIDKALALLPCETCNGTGELPNRPSYCAKKPCSDCK